MLEKLGYILNLSEQILVKEMVDNDYVFLFFEKYKFKEYGWCVYMLYMLFFFFILRVCVCSYIFCSVVGCFS